MQSKFSIQVSRRPLPGTIPEIVDAVRDILEEGLIQKIIVDVDGSIQVHKAVEGGEDLGEVSTSLESSLRNLDSITEYYVDDNGPATAYQVLVDMLLLVQSERSQPVCWVIGPDSEELLDEWLELTSRGMPQLLTGKMLPAAPTKILSSLDAGTLLLCGSKFGGNIQDIDFAVKTTIELPARDEVAVVASPRSGLQRVQWPPE